MLDLCIIIARLIRRLDRIIKRFDPFVWDYNRIAANVRSSCRGQKRLILLVLVCGNNSFLTGKESVHMFLNLENL